ncbi:procyclic acidic repetitive family protein [bacterium]|nr:procyclic acidic repetitive family protein [bacterium]
MYRLIASFMIIAFFMFGCSKEVVEDEPVSEQSTQVQPQEEIAPEPVVESVLVPEPEPEPASSCFQFQTSRCLHTGRGRSL